MPQNIVVGHKQLMAEAEAQVSHVTAAEAVAMLGRPDVVSFGDYAIRKGMANLYGLKDLDKAKFARFRKRYVPYGTVASFYLWEAAVV